jgi:membrane-bound serine protease (ClpP class)
MKGLHHLSFFSFIVILLLFAQAASAGEVMVMDIDDSITPVADDMVIDALTVCEEENYEALVISLNTPGGGFDETLNIIEAIDDSPVPVIGYVYPEGTKAWSAGTLILISTDVAAMAPFTVIGSAQPVSISASGSQPINDSKTINAIVALAREKASQHDRNTTAAEEFITKNLNLNSEEALESNVIEYIAEDIDDLLGQVDGESVKGKILNTAGATTVAYEPGISLAFMNIISNSTVSSLLLILGIYGIIFGISSPGVGAEIFGCISITLGLIGIGFDVSLAAIFLIGIGIILLIMELYASGFGIFGIAGIICLVAGSIFLVPNDFPRWYVPAEAQMTRIYYVLVPTAIVAVFFAFALYKVIEVRKRKPIIGESMIGGFAETLDNISPENSGYIKYQGEYWKANSEDTIMKGEKVEIIGKDGPVLSIRPKEK